MSKKGRTRSENGRLQVRRAQQGTPSGARRVNCMSHSQELAIVRGVSITLESDLWWAGPRVAVVRCSAGGGTWTRSSFKVSLLCDQGSLPWSRQVDGRQLSTDSSPRIPSGCGYGARCDCERLSAPRETAFPQSCGNSVTGRLLGIGGGRAAPITMHHSKDLIELDPIELQTNSIRVNLRPAQNGRHKTKR